MQFSIFSLHKPATFITVLRTLFGTVFMDKDIQRLINMWFLIIHNLGFIFIGQIKVQATIHEYN